MKSEKQKARFHGLDELRGWAALSIVIYHFTLWSEISLPWLVKGPLGLLGYYGVSVFYVLSGCVLCLIYNAKLGKEVSITNFFQKRYLRIAPLFIVILLISIAGAKLVNQDFVFEPWRFFLNFTLLFSWLAPSAHMPVGGWSIGNEMAFYSVFPLLLWMARGRIKTLILIGGILMLTLGFGIFYVKPQGENSFDFSRYVNPLNHVAFFALGILLGRFGTEYVRFRKTIFLSSVALFWVLSLTIEQVSLVAGGQGRLILLGVVGVWCWFFLTAGSYRNRAMEWLGKISYSLYLVHPIIFLGADGITKKLFPVAERSLLFSISLLLVCFLIAVPAAWVLNRFVEPLGYRLFIKSKQP